MKIFHFKSVNMNTILKMLNKCHLEHGHWLCTDKTLDLSKTENRLEYFWYFTGCIVIWFWIQFWNVKCYELNLWKPHGKRTLVFEAILNKWMSQNTILYYTKNNSYIKYSNFSFIWKGLYQNLVFEAQQKL